MADERPTADELVGLVLLLMLHDETGLAGEIDYLPEGYERMAWQNERWTHLESCDDAAVVGPVVCEQQATSTGTGFETLTAPISCPHGQPITAQSAQYGIGTLLQRMIEIGERCERVEATISALRRKGRGDG